VGVAAQGKLQLSGDSSTASLSSDFAELARRGSTGSLGDGDGDGGRFGAERTSLRRHSETPQMLITSPRDPESFASKVFMGLGDLDDLVIWCLKVYSDISLI
jgi:hypothetical protein